MINFLRYCRIHNFVGIHIHSPIKARSDNSHEHRQTTKQHSHVEAIKHTESTEAYTISIKKKKAAAYIMNRKSVYVPAHHNQQSTSTTNNR